MEITVFAVAIEMGYARGIGDGGKEAAANVASGRGYVVGGRRSVGWERG